MFAAATSREWRRNAAAALVGALLAAPAALAQTLTSVTFNGPITQCGSVDIDWSPAMALGTYVKVEAVDLSGTVLFTLEDDWSLNTKFWWPIPLAQGTQFRACVTVVSSRTGDLTVGGQECSSVQTVGGPDVYSSNCVLVNPNGSNSGVASSVTGTGMASTSSATYTVTSTTTGTDTDSTATYTPTSTGYSSFRTGSTTSTRSYTYTYSARPVPSDDINDAWNRAKKSLAAGVIAGIVVAGVAVLGGIIGLIALCICLKRRKRRREAAAAQAVPPTAYHYGPPGQPGQQQMMYVPVPAAPDNAGQPTTYSSTLYPDQTGNRSVSAEGTGPATGYAVGSETQSSPFTSATPMSSANDGTSTASLLHTNHTFGSTAGTAQDYFVTLPDQNQPAYTVYQGTANSGGGYETYQTGPSAYGVSQIGPDQPPAKS